MAKEGSTDKMARSRVSLQSEDFIRQPHSIIRPIAMSEIRREDKTAQGRSATSEQVERIRIILPHDVQVSLIEITKKRGVSLRELLVREAIPQGLRLYTTAHYDEFKRPNAP